MSQIRKIAGRAVEGVVDKAIITIFSPLITPVGAWVLAKLKWVLVLLLLLAVMLIAVIVSMTLTQKNAITKREEEKRLEEERKNQNQSGGLLAGTLPNGIEYKMLNVPYFNQWLNRDGSKSPRQIVNRPRGWELGWIICGAASSVMVAAYHGVIPDWKDDKDLKTYAYNDNGEGLPNYCSWDDIPGGAFGVTGKGYCNQSSAAGITEYLKFKTLKPKNVPVSMNNIIRAIDAGHPLILSITRPVGHILVIKGYTRDGRIIVNDPYTNVTQSPRKYSFAGENAVYDINNGFLAINWILEVGK